MTPGKDIDQTTEVATVATEDEEAAIPLIEAVPVAAVDNENSSSSRNADNDDDDAPRRVFRVMSPADLPKGYRLTVIMAKTKEEVVVLVPPGGVKRNEVFQGKEARPITKKWSDLLLAMEVSPTALIILEKSILDQSTRLTKLSYVSQYILNSWPRIRIGENMDLG